MNPLLKRFLVILSALAAALFSRYFLYAWQWHNIIPWALISFIVGLISINRKDSIYNGALFGYFLSLFYLFSDYAGKEDIVSITKLIAVVLAISLVGAIGGTTASVIGNMLKKRFQKLRNAN